MSSYQGRMKEEDIRSGATIFWCVVIFGIVCGAAAAFGTGGFVLSAAAAAAGFGLATCLGR